MKKKFFIVLLTLCLSSCGFKIVKNSNLNQYFISEINVSGDEKINYIIKNNLLSTSKSKDKLPLILNIKSNKLKSIKEKNIKNEITKYQIKISVIVEFTAKNILDKKIIAFSELGEYNVSDQYSQTISNEKKLIQNLSDKIAEEIMLELSEKLNDI